MQKIGALLLILLFLTGSIPPSERADAIHELQKMQQLFTHSEANMSWKVTIQEQIDTNSTKTLLNTLENRHLVARTSDENKVQYRMEINDFKHMSVWLIINHYQVENQADVMIEIQGETLNENILTEYDACMTYVKQKYISDKARVFTWISATYSGTINRNEFVNEMLDVLELQSVSEMTDPLTSPQKQLVLSGYSPHIKEKITTENKSFNVQIVIQTKDTEKNSVMIGTPIITDEY